MKGGVGGGEEGEASREKEGTKLDGVVVGEGEGGEREREEKEQSEESD